MLVPRCAPQSILRSSSNSSSPDSSSATGAKKSRVVVSQSKNGCSTCKARKIKCDEQKPMCRRCVRGGRLCGGYGHARDSKPQRHAVSTLQPCLNDGVRLDKQADRLSHLASLVISLDLNGQPLQGDGVWGRPFLQLSHTIDFVKAAATAFGAAYEAWLQGYLPEQHPPSLRYYVSALQKLRSGVNNGTAGAESCALASLLLAGTEILNRHDQNAFHHYLGASQILGVRRHHTSLVPDIESQILGEVKYELVMIDVLIGGYGMANTPTFPHREPQGTVMPDDGFDQPASAIIACGYTLHRAYRFIWRGRPRRYNICKDAQLCTDRGDMIAELRSVYDGLERITEKVQAESPTPMKPTHGDSALLAELYALRSQLTAALIHVLCILCPLETTYDEHQSLFHRIITDAAASTRTRRHVKSEPFSRFTARPGVLVPLGLVSLKCRDPSLRRLANAMLKEQGLEGPADGRTMAAVGARVAVLEESSGALETSKSPHHAFNIGEDQRLHGYFITEPLTTSIRERGKREVSVGFYRPNVPVAQGLGTVDYAKDEAWTIFFETIELER